MKESRKLRRNFLRRSLALLLAVILSVGAVTPAIASDTPSSGVPPVVLQDGDTNAGSSSNKGEENEGSPSSNGPEVPGEGDSSSSSEAEVPGEGDSSSSSEPETPGEGDNSSSSEPEVPGEEDNSSSSEPEVPGEGDSSSSSEPETPGEGDSSSSSGPEIPEEENSIPTEPSEDQPEYDMVIDQIYDPATGELLDLPQIMPLISSEEIPGFSGPLVTEWVTGYAHTTTAFH